MTHTMKIYPICVCFIWKQFTSHLNKGSTTEVRVGFLNPQAMACDFEQSVENAQSKNWDSLPFDMISSGLLRTEICKSTTEVPAGITEKKIAPTDKVSSCWISPHFKRKVHPIQNRERKVAYSVMPVPTRTVEPAACSTTREHCHSFLLKVTRKHQPSLSHLMLLIFKEVWDTEHVT